MIDQDEMREEGGELEDQLDALLKEALPIPLRRYTCEICGDRGRKSVKGRYSPNICSHCKYN